MSTQGKKQSKSLTKSKRKKRGIIFLAIAVVCLVVNLVLQQLNTLGTKSAVIIVSSLNALTAVCLLVFLIVGLYYLITGFTKKE
jgi:p-aminobenzoyl-glutamate transporter AbgT